MTRALLRTAALVVLALPLGGCGTAAGKVAGGLAAVAAVHVASAALSSATHRARSSARADHAYRDTSIGPATGAPAAAEEEVIAGSCADKRREFRAVYGSSRALPPQLHCDEDGEFAASAVYGSVAPGAIDRGE